MKKNGQMELPPGPSAPPAVQTMRWWFRPIPMMESCRRRYGDVFSLRLGPGTPVVMVGDAQLGKSIVQGDPALFRAGDTNGLFRPLMGDNSLLVLDGEEHLRHRRMLLPAFSAGHGQRFGERVREIVKERVSTWEPGQTLNLHDEMEKISFESIMRVIYGDEPDERHDALRELVPEMMDRCDSPFALIPWFHRHLGGISPWARVMRVVGEIDENLFEAIRQRRRDPLTEFRDDVLSLLVRTRHEDGSPLPEQEIRDELLTLMMAGYETTTGALAWSLERLMRNPEPMRKLREELAGDGPGDYMEATIKEALRIRPVVPMVARRLVESQHIGSHTFPAGTVLMVSIYLIHTDPEVFEDPEEFRPERFLVEDEDQVWIPFGGGTRRCLGASFAQVEMKVALSEILSRFELEAVGRRDEDFKRKRFTFSPSRGAAAKVAGRAGERSRAGGRRFRVKAPAEGSVPT